MPRIALIHAVAVAMPPVHEAFRKLWPQAECIDILDTSLSRDRERDGRLTEAMVDRFLLLASWFFYLSWNPWFIWVILFTSIVDYWAGRLIESAPTEKDKRNYLLLSLISNEERVSLRSTGPTFSR